MRRRVFLSISGATGATTLASGADFQSDQSPGQIHPGVWKFTLGAPEAITPVSTRYYQPSISGLVALPAVSACPIAVRGRASRRGFLVTLPLEPNEMVYGLGLQLQSFLQRGRKKTLRVNADPKMDSGDSHAPVPFYVTTRGYGVLVDTARYATVYCGNNVPKSARRLPQSPQGGTSLSPEVLPAAYRRYHAGERSQVRVEIPEAQGVDVYVFGGPTMRLAVQRYNLFSGGGVLPPRWGLGMWYRCEKEFDQAAVLRLAQEMRARRMPCDVIGLEPGWQTKAYPCSFVWSEKFPEPGAMIRELREDHYQLNLWEHAFTHPSSPIYDALWEHSGDFEVWGGIAPDFLVPEARRIYAGFHEKAHIAIGASGYKLDECDSSDFTGNWSFPDCGAFPSGADGEQMHCLFGLRYQDVIQTIFEKRKTRTYGQVRSSGSLAAPYPYALYSDLYDHREYIRALANSGFSGLLWTPEVRIAASVEDLIRRLQTVVLSPLAQVDGWFIKNPPWKQVNRDLNNAGQLDPNWEETEARCRKLMELRMRLIPYLHAAFIRYSKEGLPPFRALVMDYPEDPQTWTIDSQYLMGESLLVAPVVAGEPAREVYLPEGGWFDFWSRKRYSGKQRIQVAAPLDEIPLFVKAGTLLPLADPTEHTDDPAGWKLTILVYGDAPAPATLYEEDGGWDPKFTAVSLAWDARRKSGSVGRTGAGAGRRYEILRWEMVG